MWTFKYRSAATTYKWEFVGGSPLYSYTATSQSISTGGSWQDLATAGPDVTTPLAGDYRIEGFSRYTSPSIGALAQVGIAQGAGATPIDQLIDLEGASGAGSWISFTIDQVIAGLTANLLLRMRYYGLSGSTTYTFNVRALKITPVRVA